MKSVAITITGKKDDRRTDDTSAKILVWLNESHQDMLQQHGDDTYLNYEGMPFKVYTTKDDGRMFLILNTSNKFDLYDEKVKTVQRNHTYKSLENALELSNVDLAILEGVSEQYGTTFKRVKAIKFKTDNVIKVIERQSAFEDTNEFVEVDSSSSSNQLLLG